MLNAEQGGRNRLGIPTGLKICQALGYTVDDVRFAAIAALSRYAAEDGHRPPRDLSEIGSDTERLSRNNVDLSVAVVTMISLTA